MRYATFLLLMLCSGLSWQSVLAGSLSDYIAACKERVGLTGLPDINCQRGESTLIGTVGRLTTSNRSVDAIYLCRSPDLVGLIVHNRTGGETCFFDARSADANSDSVPDPFGSNPEDTWLTPEEMDDEKESRCYGCHANDPFIATPSVVDALVKLNILGGKHATIHYELAGDNTAPFDDWQSFVDQKMDNDNCSNGCHRQTNSERFEEIFEDIDISSMMPPREGSPWASIALPITQTFASTLNTSRWTNTGEFDWHPRSGATPTGDTGPSKAQSGTYYAYFETSEDDANDSGDVAVLESPEFYVNPSTTYVSFYYHMYGSDIGELRLEAIGSEDLEDSDEGDWETLWEISGQQQTSSTASWKSASVRLSGYSGQIKLRFKAIADGGPKGDIGIDNITIANSDLTGPTMYWPTKTISGVARKVWFSWASGNQLCKESGPMDYDRMQNYATGCGEGEVKYAEYKNGRWQERSSGNSDQCYNLLKEVTCGN